MGRPRCRSGSAKAFDIAGKMNSIAIMTETPLVAVGGENLVDYVERDGIGVGHAGGSPFNVAMALARLGAKVEYISPISTDDWGEFLADTLADSGVSLTGGRRSEPTTMARVTIREGIPSYSFERDDTAERAVTQSSLAKALSKHARAIHTGSLTLTDGADAATWEAFCAACFNRGMFVSIDPNVRLSVISDIEGYRARLMRMLDRAHLVKMSDEDLEGLFPGLSQDAAVEILRERSSAPLIVLTKGREGASAWMGKMMVHTAAQSVGELADTVGAGDTFMATLLAGLAENGLLAPAGLEALTEEMLATLLRRAATAAALNCMREGCDPPTRAELAAAWRQKV